MDKAKGFTLIEVMIVIGIVGIMAAVAIPNVSSFMDKQKITNAAESIYSQVVYARSEAIARSRNVVVNVTVDVDDPTVWAIGVSTIVNCDPTHDLGGANPCVLSVDGTDVLKRITSTDYTGIELASTTNQFLFDPRRGTAPGSNNDTISISFKNRELNVIVGVIGRARLCTPAPASVGGYSTC